MRVPPINWDAAWKCAVLVLLAWIALELHGPFDEVEALWWNATHMGAKEEAAPAPPPDAIQLPQSWVTEGWSREPLPASSPR